MTIQEEIADLKVKKKAVILAHLYTNPEIQTVADYVGDSFYLSKLAATTDAEVLVFCGVLFMAESAKLLSPDKTVLMPSKTADCPMAHMCDAETIAKVKAENDDVAVVCYINSTAELKAQATVCVTSSNAFKVVNALPNKNIFFIPDKNLGHYLAKKMPNKHFIFNEGYCPTHENLKDVAIEAVKNKHPHAKVLAHPECNEGVLNLANFVGSTSEIIKFVGEDSGKEYIICTEKGILHPLKTQNPEKTFYFPQPEPLCADMKSITLEKIAKVLKTGENSIQMSDEQMACSKLSLEKMLNLSK